MTQQHVLEGTLSVQKLRQDSSTFYRCPEGQATSRSVQRPIDEEGRRQWAGLHAALRHLVAIIFIRISSTAHTLH
jgi:hypothetical protein